MAGRPPREGTMPQDQSPAQETTAILRAMLQIVGLTCKPFVSRLWDGFRRYGETNHRSADFAYRKERDAEQLDVLTFPAVGVARGDEDPADPNLWATLRWNALAYKRSRLQPHHRPEEPMVVYISGPYTAATEEAVAANVAAAKRAGQEIMRRGHVAVCPHTMTHRWEDTGELTWADFLRGDIAILERCDAICMVGAWEDSQGALRELARARELRLYVFEGAAQVPAYIPAGDMPEPE